MKLTARQRKFLTLAAREGGFSPWYPPRGAPILRNEELGPLTKAKLVRYLGSVDTWVITKIGRAAL